MKQIKVTKSDLLTILEKNRANHRKIFEEALDGYRKQAIALFEKELERARSGKKFQVSFYLVQPVDQTKDYDRVIGMLKMSLDEQVELSEQDYASYVLDDWAWRGQFLSSNSTYSHTAATILAASD